MSPTAESPEEQSLRLKIFAAYLNDLGRIGSRHDSTRKFYVSVVSALFVLLSMAGREGLLVNVRGIVLVLVGVAGMIISLAWFEHMRSFRRIYRAKFDALRAIESRLPAQPFALETTVLSAPRSSDGRSEPKWRYAPLTFVDSWTPFAFAALFAALLLLKPAP